VLKIIQRIKRVTRPAKVAVADLDFGAWGGGQKNAKFSTEGREGDPPPYTYSLIRH